MPRRTSDKFWRRITEEENHASSSYGSSACWATPPQWSHIRRKRAKNTYELINLRALEFPTLYKNRIFQCMGKIFVWISNIPFENSHKISYPHIKIRLCNLLGNEDLRAPKSTSSWDEPREGAHPAAKPTTPAPRIILWKHPAIEKWHYSVTLSLIGWAHTQNGPPTENTTKKRK